jgi:molybdopterin-containing oxidoreductase family iron-sulfur binding subunit
MNNKTYWKYFENFNSEEQNTKLKQQEFSEKVTEEFQIEKLNGLSRRKFLALSTATLAITTTACNNYRDKGAIVPYNKKPENVIPGIANYYASTCTACSNHCGILIKTREGRPIKIDGNPDHPINKGKICSIGQANILNLYNPERYKQPLKRSGNKFSAIDWQNALNEVLQLFQRASSAGKEIAIIANPIYSPSFSALLNKLQQKYPTTNIYSYEYLGEYARKTAWAKCYGTSHFADYDFAKAKVIVAIESNFLGNEGNFVRNIREFVQNRNVDNPQNFSRLYSFETDMTLTGANADYRIPLPASKHFDLLGSILKEIITNHSHRLVASFPKEQVVGLVDKFDIHQFAKDTGINTKLLLQIVQELIENQGKCIVVAGSSLPEGIHILVNLLNEILGNNALLCSNEQPLIGLSKPEDFSALIEKIHNNSVGLLINFDVNPIFDFPKDFGFESAFSKIPIVTFTEMETETAVLSNVIIPISHNLESWGDYISSDGNYSTQQPVIEPLFGTYQKEDFILGILEGKLVQNAYHKFIMSFWQSEIYPMVNPGVDFEMFWHSALHDGVVNVGPTPALSVKFNYDVIKDLNPSIRAGSWVLLLKKSYNSGGGKYLNNGWLNELPHPITKVTWDNYVAISESSAKGLGAKNGDVVVITRAGKKLEIPIFIVPGIPNNCLVIETGFGRRNAGIVGNGVGFDPMVLVDSTTLSNGFLFNDVEVKPTGKHYKLASTVEHHSLNDTFVKDLSKTRHIIQEGTLREYLDGKFKVHRAEGLKSIIPEVKYSGVKWAMAIDMNKCVGCGACVTACNVENNVPVVGKDQVQRGREMQWIRIDTYFSGSQDNPDVSFQTMLCQHCDDAPCENVCPVVATNHSPDGLNQMVYNRCVGTRYCSNNCPFKVRRFNFYDYRDHFADGFFYQDSLKLMQNPEVTVRSRGVMEKCTFCVQRISEARQKATEEGRALKGSDVRTACQEACPAEAIIFGDMHDKDSELYYWRNHKLGYYVLEELNIKPNVTYISRLKNKNSEDIA